LGSFELQAVNGCSAFRDEFKRLYKAYMGL